MSLKTECIAAARTSGHSKMLVEIGVVSRGGWLSHSGSTMETLLFSSIALSGIWYLTRKYYINNKFLIHI
jgi:hypothetical protein